VSFDRTKASPRGRVYQAIVARYRRRRSTPREDAPDIWEDPAPDWVWKLAEAILEHTAREGDDGRRCVEEALAWCEAGNTAARSAQIVDLLGARLGPPPLARLRSFLDRAWKKAPYVL
jgi:hypothetical protein